MERCATCRHWRRDFSSNYGLQWPTDWNPCSRMEPAEYEAYGGMVTPKSGSSAVATGIDETVLLVVTSPDFGCVLWAAKKA